MNHRAKLRLMGWLRHASLFEGLTLLVLVGVAVPLKYLAGMPGLVALVGPLHGGAFMVFLLLLLASIPRTPWSRTELARLAIGACLPFGAFVNAGLLQRKALALQAVSSGQHKLPAVAKTG